MDGNYSRTQPMRMNAAEMVFFFDLPMEVCLDGVYARRGKLRPDMPWIEDASEAIDKDFLASIRDFRGQPREKILARLADRPHLTVVTFRSHNEVDAYLKDISL